MLWFRCGNAVYFLDASICNEVYGALLGRKDLCCYVSVFAQPATRDRCKFAWLKGQIAKGLIKDESLLKQFDESKSSRILGRVGEGTFQRK